MKWLLVLIPLVLSNFVKEINRERSRYNLPKIKNNKTLENELINMRSSYNGSFGDYMYSLSDVSYINFDNRTRYRRNGDVLVPGYSSFRDTGNFGPTFIIKFRNKQRACFKRKDGVFIAKKYINRNFHKCSWAYNYYPVYMNASITEAAVLKIKYKSPIGAGGRKSYFFYFK